MKKLSLIFLCWLCGAQVVAQGRFGDQQFCIGYGQLTSEQILDGVQSGFPFSPTYKTYTNDVAFGNLFMQYNFFLSLRVSVGLYVGCEKENGQVYYPDQMEPDYEVTYPLGTFSRYAYTIAPIVNVYYINNKHLKVHTSISLGDVIRNEKDTYPAANYNSVYLSGYSGGLLSGTQTVVKRNSTALTGYISPYSCDFKIAGHLWGSAELGFGYKGIISGGCSWTFGGSKRTHNVPNRNDVVLLPGSSVVPEEWQRVGKISVSKGERPGRVGEERFNFERRAEQLKQNACDINANVVVISKVAGAKRFCKGAMGGTAYFVDSIGKVRMDEERKKKTVGSESRAYVVLYVPFTVSKELSLRAMDTMQRAVIGDEKYVFRIRKEGMQHITTEDGETISVDVEFGRTYYIRLTTKGSKRKAILQLMDERRGKFESDCIASRTLVDI